MIVVTFIAVLGLTTLLMIASYREALENQYRD